jgi:putative flippase GtrA
MGQTLAAVASTLPAPPLLDIAIPVYNEARDLDRNVRRLRRYLDDRFPFETRSTIVDLVPTAIEDLRGVSRLSSQLRSFVAVGALSTLAYVACYGALRPALPGPIASAVSMLLTTFGNTAANRRFTFGATHNGAAVRDHMSGPAALSVGLTLTTAAIWGLHLLTPTAGRLTELVVLGAANLVATGVRFVLLRRSITVPHQAQPAERMRILRRTA